ncbi:avenin-3-like [Lolium rigidum]|uniref:avenin-3-like n=1 Tax=Lolium rigidum TaxID=89674 RepID=UPI001F5DB3D0|nr:avenin-3-like [Lolium rigidum]
MKTFLILTLLAMAVTIATANVQLIPSCQYQPHPEEQQPFPGLQPFPGQQQLIPGHQQHPFPGQQQSLPQLQQLNSCREFLLRQCNPVTMVTFLRSRILQLSSCQVMRQKCCQELAQIPEQSRCPAIHGVVEAIFLQQQQQQQQKQGAFFQPKKMQQIAQGLFQPQQQQCGQGASVQHQQQYHLIQGILQPQQLA